MTAGDPLPLPSPVNRDDEYLFGICGRLDVQNDLLARILDRLPATAERAVAGSPAVVAIREPAVPATPEQPGNDSPTPPTATAKPARRSPKKAAAPKATVEEGT